VPEELCRTERNPSPSKQLWHKSLAPGSSTEAPAPQPRLPGGSAGCDPAAATTWALPGGVGLAGEAWRLPLTGAAVLFPALLRLRRERGHHRLPRHALPPQLPPSLRRGGWVRHPVPLPVQVPPLPSLTASREGPSASHLTHPFPLAPRSFCWEHRPEQAVEAAPEANTTCLICLELVGDRKSHSTLVCPACKHAWFHRACIQVGAVPSSSGHSGRSAAPGPHSCSFCFSCRDRLSAMASVHSSAHSAGTGTHFSRKCSSWESESPSGWCPAARLTRQEGASAVPCQGMPQQSWPSAAL